MVELDITEVTVPFPDFRVALVVAEDLAIPSVCPAPIEALVAEAVAAAEVDETELADVPELACWRAAYKAFGVRKTSYRSSVERLVKSVRRGNGLPRVNALVDAYNSISLRYLMPVGADDLDNATPPLAFRLAREGDSFIRLGDDRRAPDPPKPGEVVYTDREKCLCRRWNWYQDARSAITGVTRRAVLTVQSLAPDSVDRVDAAASELCELFVDNFGARVGWAVADGDQPTIAVVAG